MDANAPAPSEHDSPPALARPLIFLDQHRRTILDLLATLMILSGAAGIVLALALLYPPNKSSIPGSDVIAAASTLVAVGGILLGIGGNRDDHKKEAKDRADKKAGRVTHGRA